MANLHVIVLIALSACMGTTNAAWSDWLGFGFTSPNMPSGGPPPPPPPPPAFGFGDALGSWMVLQQSPSKAAVYGYVGSASGTAVKVTVTDTAKGTSYSVDATVGILATHQRSPNYTSAGTPFGGPYNTWKALLPATPAGGDFSITATCTAGCAANATATLTNVTFGDVWHCSGQSNMWLPVDHSFSRNDTVRNITAGKYTNLRLMAGGSANGNSAATNPWMTATQAISDGNETHPTYSLFKIGAACWYFGQRLSELGVNVPIGLADTAIGGQRIEEYMDNSTINTCQNRSGETIPRSVWDGQLFGKMIMPFVDMTVKGWVWYQGENNMGALKGSSLMDIGYSCEQRVLIEGWRKVWSETPGTTDPLAPFGVVTLASSGAEGSDAAMGAMRIAQTAGYGVLPSPQLPNTFLAQAYDLDDPWGPAAGPCFTEWECCDKNGKPIGPPPPGPPPPDPSKPPDCKQTDWLIDTDFHTGADLGSAPGDSPGSCCEQCSNSTLKAKGCEFFTWANNSQPATCWFKKTNGGQRHLPGCISGSIYPPMPPSPPPPPKCTAEIKPKCELACAAAADTPVAMGGIHPRDKKPVGDRLGQAAYNLVYGGKSAYTGPTISSCALDTSKLTVTFNATLMRGDKVVMQPYGQETPSRYGMVGGSYFAVQTDPEAFCMEPRKNATTGEMYCPTWAGGSGLPVNSSTSLDGGWITLNITAGADGKSVVADLSPLNGAAPTAVRYAWSIVNCCDMNDPNLYITHPCGPASCPIMSSSNLPANPFLAKIVDGSCKCIPPQVC